MEIWIARDKTGDLYLYDKKPKKIEDVGMFMGSRDCMLVTDPLFPSVTWENSPKRVEVKLVEDD